jgi:16S rRNA (guanine527-N7)-methyltransferase
VGRPTLTTPPSSPRPGPPAPPAWPDELAAGLRALHIDLDDDRKGLLLRYLALLRHWNRAFNLSAVRDPGSMVRRHLLDSLSILPWVDQAPVLDLGSGAGLPGIPLAIARPALGFVLLDSNGKKARFMRQAVAELGLQNVEVVQERVERYARPGGFAGILSRAFAGLGDMVAGSEHLLAPGGCWLAMKGADADAEAAALPDHLAAQVVPLTVPGETAQRRLVIVSRHCAAPPPL